MVSEAGIVLSRGLERFGRGEKVGVALATRAGTLCLSPIRAPGPADGGRSRAAHREPRGGVTRQPRSALA